MGRLTNKYSSCCNLIGKKSLTYEKLKQLEDIEEELGIDLTTLFKALKDGVLYKNYANEIYLYKVRGIEKNCLALIDRFCNYAECDIPAYYKDYGKTWALTKGELKNEN